MYNSKIASASTLGVALIVASLSAPAPAAATTCATFLSSTPGGVIISGYGELNTVNSSFFAEIREVSSGRLVQIVQMREDNVPVESGSPDSSFAPVRFASFAAPAAFETTTGQRYTIAIHSADADEFLCVSEVTGTNGFAAASCSGNIIDIREGHYVVSGQTTASGAAGIIITSNRGGELQYVDFHLFPDGFAPVEGSSDRPIEPITFTVAADFRVDPRDVYHGTVVDVNRGPLCSFDIHFLGRVETDHPEMRTSTASRVLWSWGTAGVVKLPAPDRSNTE